MLSRSWETKTSCFVSKNRRKREKELRIEFVTKVGWPLLIAHWGPKEPSKPDPLWRATQLSGRLSTLVSSSCMWRLAISVAEVIGQKQSLVLIGFYVKWCSCTAEWKRSVRRGVFCSFSSFQIGSSVKKKQKGATMWNVCASWRSWYFYGVFCAYWRNAAWKSFSFF